MVTDLRVAPAASFSIFVAFIVAVVEAAVEGRHFVIFTFLILIFFYLLYFLIYLLYLIFFNFKLIQTILQ